MKLTLAIAVLALGAFQDSKPASPLSEVQHKLNGQWDQHYGGGWDTTFITCDESNKSWCHCDERGVCWGVPPQPVEGKSPRWIENDPPHCFVGNTCYGKVISHWVCEPGYKLGGVRWNEAETGVEPTHCIKAVDK